MALEVGLFEKLDDINKCFERNITEIVNLFIQTIQNKCADIRTVEQNYHGVISAIANRYIMVTTVTPDFEVPEKLRPVSF